MLLEVRSRNWMRLIDRTFLVLSISLLVGACQTVSVPLTATMVPVVTPLPTATPPPTLTPVPTPVAGGLFVDPATQLGPINPLVYGTNYGPWLFVPLDMQASVKAARLSFITFPGGNWGDLNDLDEWQIDQFIQFCKEMGTQPRIVVRLRDGSSAKAAALVKLVNITKGYGVRYWGIGNEPSLYGADYTTEQYNREWREWADAMRAVDASIQIWGPDVHQFAADLTSNPKDAAGRDWVDEFLKANGDAVDGISIHRYPFPKNTTSGPPTVDDLRVNSREWDAIVPALRASIRQWTGRDLPVAVTEVNSSWAANSGSEGTLDSHYNAIWWGDVLGRMIRQGVDMVAQFNLVGDYGIVGKYEVRPIYNVYLMYQHFGTERVYASSDDANVSVFAARREDGALTLMLVNLGSDVAQKTLVFPGDYTPPALAETWLFDTAHAAVQVEATALEPRAEISLSPESMTLLVFPAR